MCNDHLEIYAPMGFSKSRKIQKKKQKLDKGVEKMAE